jgi:hypothetical protein
MDKAQENNITEWLHNHHHPVIIIMSQSSSVKGLNVVWIPVNLKKGGQYNRMLTSGEG